MTATPKVFAPLPRTPDAFCTDSCYSNKKARRILALVHPVIVFIPFYAYVFALARGDLITKSSYFGFVSDSLKTINSRTNSSAKWLPRPRDKTVATKGRAHALRTACVTRWTSTWFSICNVLEAYPALTRVLPGIHGSQKVILALSTEDRKYASLLEVIGIIQVREFWKRMMSWLLSSSANN